MVKLNTARPMVRPDEPLSTQTIGPFKMPKISSITFAAVFAAAFVTPAFADMTVSGFAETTPWMKACRPAARALRAEQDDIMVRFRADQEMAMIAPDSNMIGIIHDLKILGYHAESLGQLVRAHCANTSARWAAFERATGFSAKVKKVRTFGNRATNLMIIKRALLGPQ
jgi:hypothetical protein